MDSWSERRVLELAERGGQGIPDKRCRVFGLIVTRESPEELWGQAETARVWLLKKETEIRPMFFPAFFV